MNTDIKVHAGDAEYLVAYFAKRDTDPKACEPWMSTICSECGDNAQASPYPHLLDEAGIVLICCEGYHQVNPNTLGLNRPEWMDWHEELVQNGGN